MPISANSPERSIVKSDITASDIHLAVYDNASDTHSPTYNTEPTVASTAAAEV